MSPDRRSCFYNKRNRLRVNTMTFFHTFPVGGQKTAGKFIIPTEAYRGEGLSYYFAKAKDYITIRKADEIAEIFTASGIPFVKGRVWTTDSMIRETVNLVNNRKNEGCIAVDMEVAGVQAVCDFYGFDLYDIRISMLASKLKRYKYEAKIEMD